MWECSEEVKGWTAFKESRSEYELVRDFKTFLSTCTILSGETNVVLVYFGSKASEGKICKCWIPVVVLRITCKDVGT